MRFVIPLVIADLMRFWQSSAILTVLNSSARIDEYLTTVRDVERRAGQTATPPTFPRPADEPLALTLEPHGCPATNLRRQNRPFVRPRRHAVISLHRGAHVARGLQRSQAGFRAFRSTRPKHRTYLGRSDRRSLDDAYLRIPSLILTGNCINTLCEQITQHR